MGRSLLTFGLHASLRGARATLRTTREVADLGLAVLAALGRVLGDDEMAVDPFPEPVDERPPAPRRPPPPPPPPPPPSVDDEDVVLERVDDHVEVETELIEEVADAGAQDGAGASIHIAPPFPGYDALRAPDVIARLASDDVAALAAIELYEQTHRRRRTVLDAVGRELRRRG